MSMIPQTPGDVWSCKLLSALKERSTPEDGAAGKAAALIGPAAFSLSSRSALSEGSAFSFRCYSEEPRCLDGTNSQPVALRSGSVDLRCWSAAFGFFGVRRCLPYVEIASATVSQCYSEGMERKALSQGPSDSLAIDEPTNGWPK